MNLPDSTSSKRGLLTLSSNLARIIVLSCPLYALDFIYASLTIFHSDSTGIFSSLSCRMCLIVLFHPIHSVSLTKYVLSFVLGFFTSSFFPLAEFGFVALVESFFCSALALRYFPAYLSVSVTQDVCSA
eukprot:TRINITY_DN8383_c0_g3_i2.p2 TRINITY_DN8383_c0_g3~~TRINITY_DN8383_c0_g3_i2.p2  ORF type:complete len:129 (+),score=4.51 TRINITY_DN8383_c0_g3_i2:42-428(+)